MRQTSKLVRWVALPLLVGAMGLPVMARQENRPPPPDGQDGAGAGGAPPAGFPPERGGDRGGDRRDDRHDRGERGGPDGMGPGGGPDGRPGGPGGPRRPPGDAQVERMRGYLDLVDRFAKLSRDPTASGVAAVVSAGDVLKQRGPDAAIEFFNKILPQVKDPSVQRAIRLQLVDLYRAGGQQDKAMEQITQLLTASDGAPQPTTPR